MKAVTKLTCCQYSFLFNCLFCIVTYFVREPQQVGLFVMCEHPVHRIHQLLQQQQEELFSNSACVYGFLSIKDHLREENEAITKRTDSLWVKKSQNYSNLQKLLGVALTLSGFLRSTSEYMVSSRSASLTKWFLRTWSTK